MNEFGWGRFSPYFKTLQGSSELQIGTKLKGEVSHVRVFNRPLLVTEALANQQHQKKK